MQQSSGKGEVTFLKRNVEDNRVGRFQSVRLPDTKCDRFELKRSSCFPFTVHPGNLCSGPQTHRFLARCNYSYQESHAAQSIKPIRTFYFSK